MNKFELRLIIEGLNEMCIFNCDFTEFINDEKYIKSSLAFYNNFKMCHITGIFRLQLR